MEGGQGSSYLWNVKSSELHCDILDEWIHHHTNQSLVTANTLYQIVTWLNLTFKNRAPYI
jgi:hypothetical protein